MSREVDYTCTECSEVVEGPFWLHVEVDCGCGMLTVVRGPYSITVEQSTRDAGKEEP